MLEKADLAFIYIPPCHPLDVHSSGVTEASARHEEPVPSYYPLKCLPSGQMVRYDSLVPLNVA